jgi:hypothetical protein
LVISFSLQQLKLLSCQSSFKHVRAAILSGSTIMLAIRQMVLLNVSIGNSEHLTMKRSATQIAALPLISPDPGGALFARLSH